MANNKIWKDNWIKDALRKGYLKPQKNGDIYRCVSQDEFGNPTSQTYRLVKVQKHKATGRIYFNLSFRGVTKSVLVNRVVALAYLPNPENLPQVNHLDGDKEHNALSNLEWSTGSDNELHAHRTGLKSGRGSANSNAKLTSRQVEEIRASDEPNMVLAERFGVGRSTIANIKLGKSWTHV